MTTDSPGPFHYVPTESVCIIFLCVFALSTILHYVQARRYGWYWIPTFVMCGLGELVGWSGRLWGSQDPQNMTPFLMQISTLILSPSFMIAAVFGLLPQIIQRLGTEYSRLPAGYHRSFVVVDGIALIIQAIGGGLASTATTIPGDQRGAHIMLAGIVLQSVTLVLFSICLIELLARYHFDKPVRVRDLESIELDYDINPRSPQHKATSPNKLVEHHSNRWKLLDPRLVLMIAGISLVLVFILIRSGYRTVELIDGWNGAIISTQWIFDCFDGVPVALSLITLGVLHPARLLGDDDETKMPLVETLVR